MSKWVSCLFIVLIGAWTAAVLALAADGHGSLERTSGPNSAGLSYVYWRNATKRAAGSVVPRPKSIVYTSPFDYLEVSTGLKFSNLLRPTCLIVELAIERYSENYLFDDIGPETKDDPLAGKRNKVGQLDEVEIVGWDGFACELMPHAEMDEAYELRADVSQHNNSSGSRKARLGAKSSWGLLRGLETLSQLIFNLKLNEQGDSLYAMNLVQIKDEPRYKHRGFMLDTARHYVPVETILKVIDAMAIDKLNVFHWHIVDDQSFPFVSKSYPQLAQKGAFRPSLIYTPRDVQFIISYAASRGIRVMPELDTPGHSYAMRHIPNVLSECYDPKTGQKNGDFGPMDPTKESAFRVVDRMLKEFGSVFRDSHFFAGGDEVDFDCWRSNPQINAWMKDHQMEANYTALSNYYMQRLHQLVKKHRKTMIVWQEVYDMGARLSRDAIISVWKYINDKPAYMAQLANVVGDGYRAILSSCWYLNYIDYGQDWIKFYNCDPRAQPIKEQDAHLVLGGEICMWTEFVDHTNVVPRTWPRASAAAERLWSPKEADDTEEFLHRLEQHRCRFLSRNIEAEPANGPGYC